MLLEDLIINQSSWSFLPTRYLYIFIHISFCFFGLFSRDLYIFYLCQAVVLCLFNNTERLTYQEIIEQLNLSHEDLVRVLHSLSCSKYKILNKEPASKSISTTDVFELNTKFTDKMRRIKVCMHKIHCLLSNKEKRLATNDCCVKGASSSSG